MKQVFDLNLIGTILPSQVFGKTDGRAQGRGHRQPLLRQRAASADPGGHLRRGQGGPGQLHPLAGRPHGANLFAPDIRVNAICPGFIESDQNRFLLRDKETGQNKRGGSAILTHTPAARFGTPDDLSGALVWLVSPASAFVTGTVVVVDGGFSACSGV
jgi:hypothetical protein